jgi:hypothetical protein
VEGDAAVLRTMGRARRLTFAVGLTLAVLALCALAASANAAVPVLVLRPTVDGSIDLTGYNREIGQPVTCLPGSWQSDSPVAISIQWLRGTAVVGTGETYHLQPADVGSEGLACSVTATNTDGSVSASSAGVPIVISDPGPGSGVTLPASSIVHADRLGNVTVVLTCHLPQPPCIDNVNLFIGKRIVATTAIKLVTRGRTQVSLHLTSYGRATLRAHPLAEGDLSVEATGNQGFGVTGGLVAIDGRLLAGQT